MPPAAADHRREGPAADAARITELEEKVAQLERDLTRAKQRRNADRARTLELEEQLGTAEETGSRRRWTKSCRFLNSLQRETLCFVQPPQSIVSSPILLDTSAMSRMSRDGAIIRRQKHRKSVLSLVAIWPVIS